MAWLHTNIFFFVTSLLLASSLAAVCPDSCICSTTRDSLHRATCSSLPDLYKYTLRQKHHNINILDLSHNNITKITHELDRLTEVVTLDLSTNGLTDINKLLYNSKKLVHLNLAHNRIKELSLSHLPTSISSLDLTNNLLRNVPTDISHLISLEHLEMAGNPLECSCENIVIRDRLISYGVYIDHVNCVSPSQFKGKSWLELKAKELCKFPTFDPDMMMGDQPIDAVKIGEETTALRSMPLTASNDLEDGKVIHDAGQNYDDDSLQYMKVGSYSSSSPAYEIEGSGEAESTTISEINEAMVEHRLYNNDHLMMSEEILPANNIQTTHEPFEGSGEGSGIGGIWDYDQNSEKAIITTTPVIEEFNPEPPTIFTEEDELNISRVDYPVHSPPNIYQGGSDWNKPNTETITASTIKTATSEATRDTTVSEQIRVTQASEVQGEASSSEENVTTHKTGTYVCIALIVILLVGLIGFAITKGQMRKRRDRRLLRHQKRDVEKASKEMVDMNKSLLGKPADVETPIEKKANGKYELVPTHDVHQKKENNGDLGNGLKYDESNGLRTDSPRDTNQNKNSSKDNNLVPEILAPQETSFDSEGAAPSSRKDSNSLSSDEYFVPINDDDATRINGNLESDTSQPLINGDPDYLSPSREYVPVYSPDMGRVRIKMTETPKPKTPVLVTRSRSNAGDIIITPSLDGNLRKSTT